MEIGVERFNYYLFKTIWHLNKLYSVNKYNWIILFYTIITYYF